MERLGDCLLCSKKNFVFIEIGEADECAQEAQELKARGEAAGCIGRYGRHDRGERRVPLRRHQRNAVLRLEEATPGRSQRPIRGRP